MDKIIVSSCLLGEAVRYDACGAQVESDLLAQWRREGRLLPCCPEMLGGLPAPRACCEIACGGGADVLAGQARVITAEGLDLSVPFVAGARQVLALARANGARFALLKERSPSCGSGIIYDGSFRSVRIPGQGVTTALLRAAGIEVYSEHQLEDLAARLRQGD